MVDLHKYNIVVVDDEPMIRSLTARFLKPSGAHVDALADGVELSEYLQQRAYTVFSVWCG